MKHETICVIDDDIVYQFTAKKILSGLEDVGKILIFSDGEKALEYLINHADSEKDLPGLIFLDINMPHMDGWSFLEMFKALKPRLKKTIIIHMVSSSPERRDIERAKKIQEVTDYIIKPITREIFKEKIAACPQK